MNIKDILEKTQTKTIAEIAKDDLTIGEKITRQALKESGCYTIVGKPGWHFNTNFPASNLGTSIYDFADQVRQREKEELRHAANVQTYESTLVPRKRHSFDLDVRLMKDLKIRCVQSDITLYEAVEDAIRDYLNKGDDRL